MMPEKYSVHKQDIENIIVATEIHIKEYMERMEYLSDRIQKWVDTYGQIPEKYQERLDNIFSLDGQIK